jgi:exopolyphosphatase/guanosine-5'-triphosphate,3'-diphosphate pyrophosphatase
MAAMLRVADALDRGHTQQIKLVNVEKKSETIVLQTAETWDHSLEILAMDEKGGLFQDVFGYRIVVN